MTFESADADKDGSVSRSEASSIPGLDFSTADADKNASLSRQEFQTAMATPRPRG
jgi:Ca2+-binding EF-hand superfamily protein